MNELKKCPFCGGEARLHSRCNYIETGNETMYFVKCNECKTESTWCYKKEKAIKAWNTRKPSEEVVAKLEEESDYWLELYDVQWKKGFIDSYADGFFDGCEKAIEIVKEGMG